MIPATTYQKHLRQVLAQRYAELTRDELIDKLFEMGVVDFSRCKILAIRQFVDALVARGEKKTNAMWVAAEHFICSYEYIRKCMYYYQDVNIE